MFREILEYLGYRIKEAARSRLFPLGILFSCMFIVLIVHLYQLQIVQGSEAQESYIEQKTLRTIDIPSTRGNIYDRNGKLLAYNELVYSVTLTDTGDYNGYQKNLMLLDLLKILDKHGESIVEELPLFINSSGKMEYSVGQAAVQRVLRDVYGKRSVQEVIDDEDCDENLSAEGLYELLFDRYGLGKYSSSSEERYEVSREDALRVINIRYILAATAYQRFRSVVVVENVKNETMTEILEHNEELLGVAIEEDYQRVYVDSTYFAHVIGYTGKASAEELEKLNEGYEEGEERYDMGDVVGKTGIEASMESELQGIKGSRTMYLDSLGRVLDVVDESEPETGQDVYLTIDHDIQVGAYHLLEQHLAGILIDRLDNAKVYNPAGTRAANRRLSIFEAYYQMINNNILDLNHFAEPDAGEAEQRIYQKFLEGQNEAVGSIREELLSPEPTPYKELGGEVPEGEDNFMKIYVSYVYDVLLDAEYLIRDKIDTTDETYIAYKTEEVISLSEFLRYALSENWIDVSKLELNEKYTSSEQTYQVLVDDICELLKQSNIFSKKIYKNLVYNQRIQGCDICLALFEQGILKPDTEAQTLLSAGGSVTAYNFMKEKIQNLEITPAQLAMDPCSAAVTITDVHSGDVLAIVSYPSYDNNKMSGSVDAEYYSKLANDLSSPLYNTATQAQKAPGSVFKLVTSAAAIETGVVKADDYIATEGVYTKQGLKLACSAYSISGVPHGSIDIVKAIAESCNYYFSEMGYRLSLAEDTEEETYWEQKGIDTLASFASQFGLDRKTGIELTELSPHISDTAPIPSAIGQGTHTFSNVQLARYLTTIANRGTVYNLTLIDRLTDSEGNLIRENEPVIVGSTTFSSDTWDVIQNGMRAVTTLNDSTKKNINCKVEIAGKTGTAEENKLRPNHANFIAYAPYDAPEIGVAVTIPHGYTASNSVKIASEVFDLVYGELTLEDIEGRGASKASNVLIYD